VSAYRVDGTFSWAMMRPLTGPTRWELAGGAEQGPGDVAVAGLLRQPRLAVDARLLDADDAR
jgi:hypothetical protein